MAAFKHYCLNCTVCISTGTSSSDSAGTFHFFHTFFPSCCQYHQNTASWYNARTIFGGRTTRHTVQRKKHKRCRSLPHDGTALHWELPLATMVGRREGRNTSLLLCGLDETYFGGNSRIKFFPLVEIRFHQTKFWLRISGQWYRVLVGWDLRKHWSSCFHQHPYSGARKMTNFLNYHLPQFWPE